MNCELDWSTQRRAHDWVRRLIESVGRVCNRPRRGTGVRLHTAGEVWYLRLPYLFYFLLPNICSRLGINAQTMTVPGCCIPRGIKLQKFPFPHYYRKTLPKGAWMGIFKPNSHNIETRISSKLHCRFQSNFAQQSRPPTTLRKWYQSGVRPPF